MKKIAEAQGDVVAQISFYRQQRQDGGLRTALTVNGEHVFHQFEEGKSPSDPALLWFVDVRCEGPRLPQDAEAARHWLLDHTEIVQRGLTSLAEKLRAGLDIDAWPLEWRIPSAPRGVRITIVCSAVKRITQQRISSILLEIRDHWQDILKRLSLPEPASH